MSGPNESGLSRYLDFFNSFHSGLPGGAYEGRAGFGAGFLDFF